MNCGSLIRSVDRSVREKVQQRKENETALVKSGTRKKFKLIVDHIIELGACIQLHCTIPFVFSRRMMFSGKPALTKISTMSGL